RRRGARRRRGRSHCGRHWSCCGWRCGGDGRGRGGPGCLAASPAARSDGDRGDGGEETLPGVTLHRSHSWVRSKVTTATLVVVTGSALRGAWGSAVSLVVRIHYGAGSQQTLR